MKLFHWQFDGVDYLLCAENLDAAREALVIQLKHWQHQNPDRFTKHIMFVLENDPIFVADPLYVISIGL